MPDLIITPPTVTAGSPAPTVEFTLTRGGANVLSEVAAGRIPNAAAGGVITIALSCGPSTSFAYLNGFSLRRVS